MADSLEDRIDKLESQIEENERKEDERMREFQEQCTREVKERLQRLNDQFQIQFDSRMSDVGDRYHQHTHGNIRNRQTEILRANKVLREVARELGSDWRFVFQCLMAGKTMDFINQETERIERQRPFMQPYKALVTWKDMKGEDFNIMDLIDVLKTCAKDELANRALMILHSDGDILYAAEDVGKGIASGVQIEDDDDDEGGMQNGIARRTSNASSYANGGPVGDRNLLALARKLGTSWYQVGTTLNIPDEDLEEIKSAEGDSYQAAFRMLWLWRDQASQDGMDKIDVVEDALKAAGRDDLVDTLKD